MSKMMVDSIALIDADLLADCLVAELSLNQSLALKVVISRAWFAASYYLVGSSCAGQLDLAAIVVVDAQRQHLQQPSDLADIGNVPRGTF